MGHWLELARYWVAVLFMVSLPPALAWWFVIHPFAGFWRRQGTGVTFAVIGALFLGAMAALMPFRDALLGADLGFRLWLLAVAAPLLVASAIVAWARSKYLSFWMLLGVPEVASAVEAPKMLSEGIYGRIRHPRYVEFVLGLAGWALLLDYAGLYVALVATIPVIHMIVLLEERELRERFGPAYADYMARVPRYLPTKVPPVPSPTRRASRDRTRHRA